MDHTVTHAVRRHASGDLETRDYARVTLPLVPGVEITCDRDETKPRQPIIRAEKQAPRGAALIAATKRRVEMFRQALHEIANGEEE